VLPLVAVMIHNAFDCIGKEVLGLCESVVVDKHELQALLLVQLRQEVLQLVNAGHEAEVESSTIRSEENIPTQLQLRSRHIHQRQSQQLQ